MSLLDPKTTAVLSGLVALSPPLGALERRVSFQLYRRLAAGSPVASGTIAADLQIAGEEVERILRRWYGVFRDESARVVSFWGLSLQETRHRFTVQDRLLYTWCALDALSLPEVLQRRAYVVSTCPITGGTIQLTVTEDGIENLDPAGTVISLILLEAGGWRHDVVHRFCRYVHFFRSSAAGAVWTARNKGTFLISLEDAYSLAKNKNAARFGRVLGRLSHERLPSAG